MFLTRKSGRANLTDKKLLFQILKKLEILTKTSMEQLKLIKWLKKKINKLTKKPKKEIISNFGSTIISQIAKFSTANKAYRFQISLSTLKLLAIKSIIGPQLIINFI